MVRVDGLAAAIDTLEGFDLDGASDEELARWAVAVDVQAARLEALRARALAAVDARRVWEVDGSRSCAAWAARHRRCPRSRMASAVRLGRALRSMPLVDAAFAAGDLGVDHARQLVGCWRFAPSEFAGFERSLVRFARELSWEDFVRVCAEWCQAVDPDRDDRERDRAFRRRHLLVDRRADGSLWLTSGQLDPVGAEAFCNELSRLERELFDQDLTAARAEHGPDVPLSRLGRTPAQRRADALVEMAYRSRTAPADGQRPEPLVSVYVDYETATGRLCELASGVPVTAHQLLPVITRAEVERVVFGPGNRVIELGKRARFFTGGLRRTVELRDRHCQHPGCRVPAGDCQVDHVVSYGAGGETTQANGRL